MTVEIRLLGDLELRVDGHALDVGHARQQCVLAVLLVEANRVVPVDQLLERAWGDRLPQRARSGLSSYVSRLRQALAGCPYLTINRRSGGYQLTVDPLLVDLHRFRRLVGEARGAAHAEDAEALLGEALDLWRGEAFATLDTAWLTGLRVSLAAERLSAELDRNDHALALGRHSTMPARLSALAAASPLDERLAAQLMLALYRCGRQADALLYFDEVRHRLADELGADPGPPLRALHQQILTNDPALGAPGVPTPTVRAPTPTPRQLPAPPRGFAGRTPELKALDKVADEPGGTVVISAISGTAGVGKTALAVYWAHSAADRFPDGQLYVNLRGFDASGPALDPAEVVRGFLDALGVPAERIPASDAAQVGLYRTLVVGQRLLLVLDNARDVEQVRPLLPGSPGCVVVVTSRRQLTGLLVDVGAHPLHLDVLSVTEARDLLEARLGWGRVAAEPDAADEIIARCARLPLALSIVAARAESHPHFPLAALARELGEARSTLYSDPGTDLRTVFSWSYQALGPEAARLFRLLGRHGGPDISAPAAASLAGLPPAQVAPLLVELTNGNLLTEHRPGRYSFHDLLRRYAADLESGSEPVRRVLDHYLHTAHPAARLLNPGLDPIPVGPPAPGVTPEHLTDAAQALSWLTVEHAVLQGAVQQAAVAGFDAHTCQLAFAVDTFLSRRGHWHELAANGRAALPAARRLGDRVAEARALRMLARADIRLGLLDDAHARLRQALELYAQAGQQGGLCHTHTDLALLWERRGRHDVALEHAELAELVARGVGNDHWLGVALNLVGWYCTHVGDYARAVNACQQALALHEALDNRFSQAATLDSLGYAHHHLGQFRDAIDCYRRALDLLSENGDLAGEAEALTHLGETHRAAGDPAAARTAWQRALDILTELDHPDADRVREHLSAI
jgi:DNA-binding SARP family transcriptional activator/tetratricopeptide (TPR) repeat protein